MNDPESNVGDESVPEMGSSGSPGEPSMPTDRVLDYLIREAVSDSSPPDLSRRILTRLANENDRQAGPGKPNSPRQASASPPKKPVTWVALGTLVAAIAASVVGVLFFKADDAADRPSVVAEVDGKGLLDGNGTNRKTTGQRSGREMTASPEPRVSKRNDAGEFPREVPDRPRDGSRESSPPSRKRLSKPGRSLLAERSNSDSPGEPQRTRQAGQPEPGGLLSSSAKQGEGTETIGGEGTSELPPPNVSVPPPRGSSPDSLRLVSRTLDDRIGEFWSQAGVTPTAVRSLEDTVAAVGEMLGVELGSVAIEDSSTIQKLLRAPPLAEACAKRWLRQVTDGGFQRLDAAARERLLASITPCFEGEQRLDSALVRLIRGDSDASSDWYSAMRVQGEVRMVASLAALTMDVDLRCIRCHDAYIERTGRLADYHAFAAIVKTGLVRTDDRWQVVPAGAATGEVFYETPSGRQRLAVPKVPSGWTDAAEEITSLEQWSQSLENQPRFARGLVDSVWQMIHGRPLGQNAVDPVSAPLTDALIMLRQELVDDVLDSDFDVSRLTSLVVGSTANRREVPAALLSQHARPADVRRGLELVGAFAASMPPRPKLAAAERSALAVRGILSRMKQPREAADAVILAQPGGNAGTKRSDGSTNSGSTHAKEDAIPIDFPSDAGPFPASWIESIDDVDQQIAHLVYLAGQTELSPKSEAVVGVLQQSELSREVVLQRIWWLLKPR